MHRALKLYKPRIRPLSYPSRNREPINFCLVLQLLLLSPPFFLSVVWIKVRPRFFDQVGHETMYAPSGNKHFFTKSFIATPTKIMNGAVKNWAQF